MPKAGDTITLQVRGLPLSVYDALRIEAVKAKNLPLKHRTAAILAKEIIKAWLIQQAQAQKAGKPVKTGLPATYDSLPDGARLIATDLDTGRGIYKTADNRLIMEL